MLDLNKLKPVFNILVYGILAIVALVYLSSCSNRGFTKQDYLDRNKNVFIFKSGVEGEPETIWLEEKYGARPLLTKGQHKKQYKRWLSK